MSEPAKDPERRAELQQERDLIDVKERVCSLLEPLEADSRKRVLAAVVCLTIDGAADYALGFFAARRPR